MKKFHFPLDRVLAWRQTQVRLEEVTLARLNAERQLLELRIGALDQALAEARAHRLGVKSALPIEIAALEHFQASAAAQSRHLLREAGSLEAKIAQQSQVVIGRRREAELLGRLRERRLDAWRKASDKEVEQQAEESYLARFTRSA
jgi:hypothetical protein